MKRGRYIALALVALLVAVAMPAVAIAQSAGEDQYTDPLQGGGPSGGGSSSSGSGGGSGGSGGGGGNTTPAAQTQSDSGGDTSQAKPAQSGDSSNLPHTGFPIAILVGSGLILLSGGLALRRPA